MSQTFSERDAWKGHRGREYQQPGNYNTVPGRYSKTQAHRQARRARVLIEMPEADVQEEVVAYTDGAFITRAR